MMADECASNQARGSTSPLMAPERLEEPLRIRLQLTTKPDSSGIQELQGLAQSEDKQPIQELLIPSPTSQKPSMPAKTSAWALATGTQLNLVGDVADETVEHIESHVPNPLRLLHKRYCQGCRPNPLHRPFTSRCELHRHAGCGGSVSPTEEAPLVGVDNDLPVMEPLSQFADSYILAQAGERLLIDQHALYERIRYERLRNDESLWLPQPRLVATRIQLTLSRSTPCILFATI